jgi:hypothetical protein
MNEYMTTFLSTNTIRFSPFFSCTFWVNNTGGPAAVPLRSFFVLITGAQGMLRGSTTKKEKGKDRGESGD